MDGAGGADAHEEAMDVEPDLGRLGFQDVHAIVLKNLDDTHPIGTYVPDSKEPRLRRLIVMGFDKRTPNTANRAVNHDGANVRLDSSPNRLGTVAWTSISSPT
ncbi:hypothetical protein AWENTII_013011 [Aspergillus wentii]